MARTPAPAVACRLAPLHPERSARRRQCHRPAAGTAAGSPAAACRGAARARAGGRARRRRHTRGPGRCPGASPAGRPRAARAAVRPATPAPPSLPPGARPAAPTTASAAPRPGPFPRPAVPCQRRSWLASDRSTRPGPATARAGRSPPPAARAGPRTPPPAALRMARSVPSPEAPGGSNRPGRSERCPRAGPPGPHLNRPGPEPGWCGRPRCARSVAAPAHRVRRTGFGSRPARPWDRTSTAQAGGPSTGRRSAG